MSTATTTAKSPSAYDLTEVRTSILDNRRLTSRDCEELRLILTLKIERVQHGLLI